MKKGQAKEARSAYLRKVGENRRKFEMAREIQRLTVRFRGLDVVRAQEVRA
ncbi:MAG: hypothetical protein HY646_13760 [Acidobacteria bacterium]|nr:hypothetical protein [Acidobacteriota bacterium]